MHPLELDLGEHFEENKKFKYRNSLPYTIKKLKLTHTDTEHGFRIIKIDDKTKGQVLFVLSTYEVLEEFANLLNYNTSTIEQIVKSKKLELVDYRLQQLIAYVKNCDIDQI